MHSPVFDKAFFGNPPKSYDNIDVGLVCGKLVFSMTDSQVLSGANVNQSIVAAPAFGNATLMGFLYDANENVVASNNDSAGGGPFKISATVAAGTYVLGVVGDNASSYGDYTIYLGCDSNSDGGGSNQAGQPCTNAAGEAGVYDCQANCIPNEVVTDWVGDGMCDDGTYSYYLNCSAFNNDGGDCN